MILTCPECTTRYQTDAAFPPAGRKVRCAKCGHVWHQEGPQPEPEPEIEIAPPPRATPAPELVTRGAYVAPAAVAPVVEAPPQKKSAIWERLGLVAGWLGLAAVILVIGGAALSYRQTIATLWPQSASLYSGLGLNVNARGIAFSGVTRRYETEDGQIVLAIAGSIVNVSGRELPVPPIRVTLTDGGKRELYHWNFTPDVATLRAGQSASFLTRMSNPPDGARHMEMRFADGAR
jgi:predicted Zn finger-like uncharacterized protein